MTKQESFEIFWGAYPRKVGKGACRKIWDRKKFDEETLNKMLETIKWQKNLIQWQNPSYIPHPSTWLNQERWEDERDDKLMVSEVATPHDQLNELQRIIKEKRDKMRNGGVINNVK